jgi:hypothetical protein
MALSVGDPLPWHAVAMTGHGVVSLEAFGGLRTTLVFCASLRDPRAERICRELLAAQDAPDGKSAALVIVCADRPAAMKHPLFAELTRRFALIWDDSFTLHDEFGLREGSTFRLQAVQIDEGQRVVARLAFSDPARFVRELLNFPVGQNPGHPPVLSVPGILDHADCQRLLEAWERDGGEESGYMLPDAKGTPVEILNALRKRRRDFVLEPGSDLYRCIWDRLRTRLFPAMRRAFQFDVVGAERLLVGRYSAESGGHFEKHRDWEGADSHREFGVTINLNNEFTGGALEFPEYPGQSFVPAPGMALAYSGALMHRVARVTTGHRFCLLSFLYGPRGEAALQRYIEAHGRKYRKVVLS